MFATLSFVDERQFLTVIQPVLAPAESPPADPAPTESPPTDPTLAESSAEPLHSTAGDALTEIS
jgi:hypothetical protein